MQKNKQNWKIIGSLGGLALVIVLALVLPNTSLFQASLQNTLHNAAGSAPSANCQQIQTITLPQSPLPANTAAAIAITTTPADFAGTFTYSASSGNLDDGNGNTGSYIVSRSKKVTFSGGDGGTNITIQAQGSGNTGCVATIPVVQSSTVACLSLKVVTSPSPIPENQSAQITILPSPANFDGSYLYEASSGAFLIQAADTAESGNQTKTLVTKNTNVLYNGGKRGEKIVIRALGQGNDQCTATIPIIQ